MTFVLWFQGIGDIQLAYQCFRLALASNNDHAEAYNNLGVLEMRKGHTEQVKPVLLLVQPVSDWEKFPGSGYDN